jgi:hypothetical protein
MATEAARLESKESTGGKEKKRKTYLTHTGLLMEGMWTEFAEQIVKY